MCEVAGTLILFTLARLVDLVNRLPFKYEFESHLLRRFDRLLTGIVVGWCLMKDPRPLYHLKGNQPQNPPIEEKLQPRGNLVIF